MTPSLGTLEKISEALGVGMNRFFVPETHGEVLMEDPFIQGLRPYLRQLDWAQWQSILKRLQAISDHFDGNDVHLPNHVAARANSNGNGNYLHAQAGEASRSVGMKLPPLASRPRRDHGTHHPAHR